MIKSCLVTGGTGFIGSALVRGLVEAGYRVRVIDNDSRGATARLSNIRDEIELIRGDIRDPDAVGRAVQGMDCVFHLAFVNGTESFYAVPELVLEVGVKGMMNVIESCIQHGVGDLILASSAEVYQTPPVLPTDETVPLSIPDPLNPRYSYAGGKLISELMTLNYGRSQFRRVIIFRPHNIYGPDMGWEHVIPQLATRVRALVTANSSGAIMLPIQGTGNETRSFCYIDDLIRGLLLLTSSGEHLNIYNIGNSEEVTIRELASRMGDYFGCNVNVDAGSLQCGGTPRRCPDISKMRAIGYEPMVSLAQGLQETLRWYDEHSHEAPIHLKEFLHLAKTSRNL